MIRANRPVRSRIYLAKIHPTYVSRCLSPRTAIYMRRTATLSPRNPSSRSEEHTSELQSLMRISYAVFCLKKTNKQTKHHHEIQHTQILHNNQLKNTTLYTKHPV